MKRYIFTILIAAFVFLGFVGQSSADLTVTNEVMSVWGTKRVVMFDIALDTSYPAGGETLTKGSRRMAAVDQVIIPPKNGYTFEYDETNEKVKVFASAPAIVYEEQQTIATAAVTLNYPAAYIIAVAQANANIAITDTGATLAANQCKPTAALAVGTRTGLTFHAGLSGVVYVTYVTQAWKEVWDNLVQSEVVTVTSNVGEMANRSVGIQSIRVSSSSGTTLNAMLMLDKDDTVATSEVEVDWSPAGDSGTTTELTFYAAEATAATVTYIKKPTSGFLYDNLVEEETATLTAVGEGNLQHLQYPVLMWSYAGQIPINGQTTQAIINERGTAGTAEAYMFWTEGSGVTQFGAAITNQATAVSTATYIKGRPQDIPFLIPLEVRNAQNLSALTGVQVIMIGR